MAPRKNSAECYVNIFISNSANFNVFSPFRPSVKNHEWHRPVKVLTLTVYKIPSGDHCQAHEKLERLLL